MFSRIRDLLEGRSPRWQTVRKKFLVANPECAACGTTKKLEVHHVLPVHVWPLGELLTANMLPLCRTCHFTFGHLKNWDKYNPTVREDAALWRKKMVG